MKTEFDNTENEALNKTDVSGSSFEHYMIYVNGVFKLDVYSFKEVQDYYNKYKLYGKITYEKIA